MEYDRVGKINIGFGNLHTPYTLEESDGLEWIVKMNALFCSIDILNLHT